MIIKKYKRLDPGHKDLLVSVVFANICVYAAYTPRNAKGEVNGEEDATKTVFCMNNGMVMVCDVPVKTVDQIFSSMK